MTIIPSSNEATAEFLLSAIGPKAEDLAIISCGDALSQYNGEVINIDFSSLTAKVARNGIRHLLPEGLFFPPGELSVIPIQGVDRLKKLNRHNQQKELLDRFFEPFDTEYFRAGLSLQQTLTELENDAQDNLISELQESDCYDDTYVASLARHLLEWSDLKGNLPMLALMSQNILGHEVAVNHTSTLDGETPVPVSVVRFSVFVDGLSADEYIRLSQAYRPFFDKLHQWYLPYDCRSTFIVHAHYRHMTLRNNLILDYNTRLI